MTNTPHGQVPEALRLADEWQRKTQREADRRNSAYDHYGMGNTPETVNPLGYKMAAELRRQHARIAELESELEAVGAGGVQALSAAPAVDIATVGEAQAFEAWYKQDCVIEGAAAKMAAKAAWKARAALAASPTPPAEQQAAKVAPAIGDELRDTLVAVSAAIAEQDDRTAQKMIREILEASPTPPAEQATTTEAATPKAGVTTGAALGGVYAELPQPDSWFHFTPQYWENTLRDFADRTHALRMEQAATKAAPGEWTEQDALGILNQLSDGPFGQSDVDDALDFMRLVDTARRDKAAPVKACVCGELQAPGTVHRVDGPCYVAAPQQEAQEPVALLVRKNSWRAGQWEAAPPDSPSYGLAWANQRQYVYAAPQPAPAPLSESEYKRGYRNGYERRDAEVRGALV